MASDWAWGKPLYVQVRDALLARITSGTWTLAPAIPNEQDLAHELGVGPGTLREVLDLMQAEQVITRRQRRGTFVRDPASDELATLSRPPGRQILGRAELVEIAERAAAKLERERLRLGEGQSVYRIHRVRCRSDQVFMVEDVVLPAELFPGLLDNKSCADDLNVLTKAYRIPLHTASERISMVRASEGVAGALGIAPGTDVIHLDRVVSMLDGEQPIEWRIAHCLLPDGHYVAKPIQGALTSTHRGRPAGS